MEVYKEMYLTMVRATEQTLDILIEAQRKCEELYVTAGGDPDEEPPLHISRSLSKAASFRSKSDK